MKKIIVAQNSFNKQLPKFYKDRLNFISHSTTLKDFVQPILFLNTLLDAIRKAHHLQ